MIKQKARKVKASDLRKKKYIHPRQKTRKEFNVYKGIAFWGWFIAILLMIFLISFAIFPTLGYKYRELKTQLSECQKVIDLCDGLMFTTSEYLRELCCCQEQVPQKEYSCSIEGHWLNIVSTDKNNYYGLNLIYYGIDELDEELLEYNLKVFDCKVIE